MFYPFTLPPFFLPELKKHPNVDHSIAIISRLGIVVLLIAYIFIFVKKSQDPLEGICKLDALIIISRNQVQTKDIEENIYHRQEWGELT